MAPGANRGARAAACAPGRCRRRRRASRLRAVALSDKARTFGISLLIHGVLGGLLAALAVPHVIDRAPDLIELEIVPAPPPDKALDEPAALPPPPEPAPPPLPEVPVQERPAQVPEQARVVKVEEPRPFQEDAAQEDGERQAPEGAAAVPAPTMPLPVLDMVATVGTGTSDYVTTSSSAGSVPVMAGPGGGRGGAGMGRGAPGPLANQGAVDVQVSRDWQITAMPEAINQGDFEPAYPAVARREGREAVVVVRLYIDAEGVVRRAEVIEGPEDPGFRASARAYARRLRFRPARSGDTPVAARIDWTVYFYARN